MLVFETVSGMVGATRPTVGVDAGGYVGDRAKEQQARRTMEKLPGEVLLSTFGHIPFHTNFDLYYVQSVPMPPSKTFIHSGYP